MVYIVATGRDLERYGFRRYLYNGQTVVQEPVQAQLGQYAVIEGDNEQIAQNLADRLQSGLMGGRVCQTREDADDYIAEYVG